VGPAAREGSGTLGPMASFATVPADRRVRWGILGVADIARKRVVPAIAASATGEVVAIASRDAARAEAAARQLGIPRSYGAYADLLRDDAVDAVYIPLPNSLHAEWTVRAAEAGKHVLCEKPMARTVAECHAMVAACRRGGVLFMEGLMYRFHPQHARAQEILRSGLIGRPRIVRSSFTVRLGRPPTDIRFDPAVGGGALFDLGVYALDGVRFALGREPTAVTGRVPVDRERAVDLSAAAVLAFDDDVLAVISVSFEAAGGGEYEIIGTDGRVRVRPAYGQQPNVGSAVCWEAGERCGEERFPPTDQHRLQADAFGRALQTGVPPAIADEAGIGNIAVIEALRRG
jgi:D-xylose 1-dehydrogenase (NADP+, D-xylono-1,5-lactone-forming)